MERPFDEHIISVNILDSYHQKLRASLISDVVIVGAGPSGLMLAGLLGSAGVKCVVLEANLAPGGGIWGGGMGMNEVVFQNEALHLLEKIGLRTVPAGKVHTADSCEFAASLIVFAIRNGATILNLVTVEDLCILNDKVTGVVASRTGISGRYQVDPIMFTCRATVDGTGHDAVLANYLSRQGYPIPSPTGRPLTLGAMDVVAGEHFVVDHAGEVFPGLYLMGMSVSASFNGPRMGPIFGGMLLSAEKVAGLLMQNLK